MGKLFKRFKKFHLTVQAPGHIPRYAQKYMTALAKWNYKATDLPRNIFIPSHVEGD